ncbi:MAG: redoxin domain-containing protein [Phycisphaerae bacterium]
MPVSFNRNCLIVAAILTAPACFALDIGDPAPALSITQWVKGEPVSIADGRDKNVFVIEFWSTWCPACRRSIPYLSSIQDDFGKKGVVVVAVTDEQNDVDAVRRFVKKHDEEIHYTIAIDSKRETKAAYFGEANVESLNYAFIVDKEGKIAWQGPTRRGLRKALSRIVAGESGQDETRQWYSGRMLARMYLKVVSEGNQPEKAKALGARAFDLMKNDANGLNLLSWQILTDQQVVHRDYAFALQLATRADELMGHEDPAVLDTLALAMFENSDVDGAIETQKKAIELCEDPHWKREFEGRLKRFEDARK